jgi:outer membrane receptor for monomeric catechols
MPAAILRTLMIAVVAVCFAKGADAGERPRHAPASSQGLALSSQSAAANKSPLRVTSLKRNAVRRLAADRDPYADPAAPYKADRLSLPHAPEPILNTPGQTTVLTRQILDDMNATTLRDALRSTAGVTVR